MQTSLTPAQRRLRVHWFALRIAVTTVGLLFVVLFSSLIVSLLAQDSKQAKQPKPAKVELKAAPVNLQPPASHVETPQPGVRVKHQVPEQRGRKQYHA